MTGYVDEHGQPKIVLVVRGQKQQQAIEAVIDTGFNGHLCLPLPIAVQLGLELAGYQFVELADGSVHHDLTFAGTAILDNQEVAAEISVTESEEALLATGMLKSQKLEIGFDIPPSIPHAIHQKACTNCPKMNNKPYALSEFPA